MSASGLPNRSLARRLLSTCMRAQWIVGGTCAAVAIAYPQTEVYGAICGAFMNAFIAKLLKRIIAQKRPMFVEPVTKAAAGKRNVSVAPAAAAAPAGSDAAASVTELAASVVQEAASEVAASAVDAAVFAADVLGVEHPSSAPLLAALPHPQPSEKHLGHGMPSSHAMSLFYFATYLTLAAYSTGGTVITSAGSPVQPHPFVQLLRTYLPTWLQHSWTHGWTRPLLVALLYTLVSFECWTRIRRRLHSWQQIAVGAFLGSAVATVHWHRVMPLVRELSKDVPPLAERSTEFKLVLVAFFAIVGALTLERNTQRVAKRVVRNAWERISRNNTRRKNP